MKNRFPHCILAIFMASLLLASSAASHAAPAAKKDAGKNDSLLKKYNESIIAITKKAIPMVVNIAATKAARQNEIHEYDMDGNQTRKFPFKAPVEPKAMGSGVIIDRKGYIITNHHVVKDAKTIKITLADRREFNCSVIGADPATDIAVIKIDGAVPADLPVMRMADSDRLEVGELVIAIGNPFGFSHTVTTGIISATGRQSVGLADYENFIQTDAAINPGNSGGALIDINGRLIGINTAIFSKSGGYMGIGFAIPSNLIQEVVKQLIASGSVVRGWLGVYIQDVTKDIAEAFKYAGEGGALVSDIIKDSPATGSGIRKGDIITKVDGTNVKDVNHLRRMVSLKKPGAAVKLTVFRDGKSAELAMTVGTLPDKPLAPPADMREKEDQLGVVVKDIDEELAYKYRTADRSGVIITQIKEDSPAARAGLKAGDVLKEIDRMPVDTVKTYNDIVGNLMGKKKLLLLITRGGTHKFVVVDLDQ